MTTSCPACNHSNPLDNRFCGMCGARLERRRMPDSELLPEDSDLRGLPAESPRAAGAAHEPLYDDLTPLRQHTRAAAVEEPPAPETFMGFELDQNGKASATKTAGDSGYAVSGPSFLGLSEATNGAAPDYLLEDDRPRHSAGKWFLAIVALVAVLAYGQWRANGRGQTLFAGLPSIRAPKPVTQNPTPATSANAGDDASSPDMDIAPTNSDLKAQTEAAKKADPNPPSADANSTPDAKSTKEANASNSKPEADTPDPGKSVDSKATADKKTAQTEADDKNAPAQSDEDADAAKTDAEPTPTKSPAKQPAARLEKTKAAKVKPPRTADPAVALLAEGQKYLYGQGVHKSCDRALNLIHGAANQGNAAARSQLGGMYATGNCAPFDRVMAYRWFTLALDASPRNPSVQRTRSMLWREMTDIERQRAHS